MGNQLRGRRSVRRGLALGVGMLIVAMCMGLGASVASADGAAPFLQIRKADAVDPKNVKLDFIYTGNESDLGGLKLTQAGADVKTNGAATAVTAKKAVVMVVDTGGAMDDNGGLNNLRGGLVNVVNSSPDGTGFAVIAAGDTTVPVFDLETDKDTVIAKINNSLGASPKKGTATWKALRNAGDLLIKNPAFQPNIILAVAANDTVSPKDEPAARTSVTQSGSSVFALEKLGAMDPTPYDSLVTQSGGLVTTTDNAQGMTALATNAGVTINKQQYTVAYDSGLKIQEVSEIQLAVGGATSDASFILGGVYKGSSALRPIVVSRSGASDIFSNKGVLIAALILAALAAGGFAYALTSLFVKDDLSNVLQPYADPYGAGSAVEEEGSALGKSALIARAVELTEQVAENQGLLTRAEGALERANLPLRAGEALFFYAIIVVVVTVFGLFWTRNMIGGIIFGVLGAMIPVVMVNFRASRRRKAFMSQLPDTLQLLSGTLRAGYSLMQGVEAVSQEVDDPMGVELRRVVTEARLGRPLEESLEASADRMDSPDFAWAVMAIRIQREVGGNLSELLMTVADTMIARERLRRDVAALTAEGRVSAVVLAGLPPGLGLIMYVLNPEYVSTLFTDGLGIGMLITAAVSMMIGFFWMKKIITIEI